MKILKIKLNNLRNEGHFQFQTEFKKLVEKFTAQGLNIETLFLAYLVLFEQEDEAMELIRKSAVTEQIAESDYVRDTTFGGLRDAVEAAANHFNADKREASRVLMVLIDHYRQTPRLALDDETAAIYNMLQELRGAHLPQVQTLGLTEWVDQLEADNRATETLIGHRDDESSEKTKIRMKNIRKVIDQAYRDIIERINALIIVNGVAGYEEFVSELNARIERYGKK